MRPRRRVASTVRATAPLPFGRGLGRGEAEAGTTGSDRGSASRKAGPLHRPRGLFSVISGRDIGRHVMTTAPLTVEHLVVENLVVLRALQVLRNAAQQGF